MTILPFAGRLWRYIEEQAPQLTAGFVGQAD
jgi:hypothetical protein